MSESLVARHCPLVYPWKGHGKFLECAGRAKTATQAVVLADPHPRCTAKMGGGNPPIFQFFSMYFFIFLHYFLENYTREPSLTQEGGITSKLSSERSCGLRAKTLRKTTRKLDSPLQYSKNPYATKPPTFGALHSSFGGVDYASSYFSRGYRTQTMNSSSGQ